MQKELQARRAQAESVFNDLQQFKNEVIEKLKSFGLNEFNEVDSELLRLQGDYRTINGLLNKPVAKPSKVSPEAETVDVDAATEEK